jgi:hypothetical protein
LQDPSKSQTFTAVFDAPEPETVEGSFADPAVAVTKFDLGFITVDDTTSPAGHCS